MPPVFDDYVRIFHAGGDRGGPSRGMTWSEIASRLSRPFHPEVQFREIAGDDASHNPELGDIEPRSGSVSRLLLEDLVDFLSDWTGEDQTCWFGMWDGWGSWWKGAHEPGQPADDERDRVLKNTPTFGGPSRDYFLLRGPLASVLPLYDLAGDQSPSLWWPNARGWFVSTEVDAFSSYLGGSAALVEALVAVTGIETARIGLDAPLDWGL